MTEKANSRELALDVLLEILEKGRMSHVILNQALSKYQYLEKQDRAFITRLVEGTLSYVIQLDWVLDSFSSVKTKKMKPVIRTLLRMSAYQLLYMDRIFRKDLFRKYFSGKRSSAESFFEKNQRYKAEYCCEPSAPDQRENKIIYIHRSPQKSTAHGFYNRSHGLIPGKSCQRGRHSFKGYEPGA